MEATSLLLDLVAAALAAGAVIDVWGSGDIFNPLRVWIDARKTYLASTALRWPPRRPRLVLLLSCPFCLSYWVGAACFALTQHQTLRLGILALAAIRLSNLINGLLPKELQYAFTVTPEEVRQPPSPTPSPVSHPQPAQSSLSKSPSHTYDGTTLPRVSSLSKYWP
jgi:hypothetical protein